MKKQKEWAGGNLVHLRSEDVSPFTHIILTDLDLAVADDPEIKGLGKGLWYWIRAHHLSEVSARQVMEALGCGRTKARTVLHDLARAGLVTLENRPHPETGMLQGARWVLTGTLLPLKSAIPRASRELPS